ncbi:MAG: thermonuclease family protein [Bosea sp. (in: a-proteobacteria)]
MARLLKIAGKIEIDQFWPDGSSDADTTKIQLSVEPGAFSFDFDGQGFRRTDVFEGAEARGTGRKQVISAARKVTVRLQGIDAPELHYRASALKQSPEISAAERAEFNRLNGKERRQFLGETATVALAEFLSTLGAGSIPCEFYSFVDKPGDAIDTYGRFVGNIMVGQGFLTDINLWLTEQGWVYPTFYSSMDDAEIQLFLDAMAKGKTKGRAWASYNRDTRKFDPGLVYRGKGVPVNAAADVGPVLMPKIFRRLLAFNFEKAAGVRSGSFKAYLKERRDECFALGDFLEQGPDAAALTTLDRFMTGTRFRPEPQELVFREKSSSLFDANGVRITAF